MKIHLVLFVNPTYILSEIIRWHSDIINHLVSQTEKKYYTLCDILTLPMFNIDYINHLNYCPTLKNKIMDGEILNEKILILQL